MILEWILGIKKALLRQLGQFEQEFYLYYTILDKYEIS